MLFLVGLGLGDENDVTLAGLAAIKSSVRLYLEAYTSVLGASKERMEELYGKQVIVADREMVELQADEILAGADKEDVAFLVVGDPLGATTHSDLILRARALGIPYRVIHNAGIMSAVASCGLALYNFGQTVSIPFFTEGWRPDSWLERIRENRRIGLHTLCLLDIKVKEQSDENLARGRKIYEPPRFMSVPTALSQLLSLLPSTSSTPDDALLDPSTTLAISLSRVGQSSQKLVSGTLAELATLDEDAFGPPLHSFVIVGSRLHDLELEFGKDWAVDKATWDKVGREVYGVQT